MNKYIYDGPVMFFGRYVGNWHGETIADSEAKARSNLMYQYKKRNRRIEGSGGIVLPGKLKTVRC